MNCLKKWKDKLSLILEINYKIINYILMKSYWRFYAASEKLKKNCKLVSENNLI